MIALAKRAYLYSCMIEQVTWVWSLNASSHYTTECLSFVTRNHDLLVMFTYEIPAFFAVGERWLRVPMQRRVSLAGQQS